MKYLKLAIALLAGIVALAACKSQYDALLASNDVDAKYKAAFEYFNQGRYQKAATLFESMAVLTSGKARDDTVLFYWGLSNYRYKDYYTAESNFDRFIEVYPRSPFTEQARFLRIDCLYRSTLRYELDQKPTYTAISAINEYLTDYPETDYRSDCMVMLKDLNNRLDTKAFEGAKLYYKMEDYKASRVALRNVLKDNSENIYREDVLYYIAMSSYKYAQLSVRDKQKERYLTFVDDYLNFVGEFPESPYRKELDTLYARAQKSLGRYASVEDLPQMTGRDFERDRKVQARAEKKEAKKAAAKK